MEHTLIFCHCASFGCSPAFSFFFADFSQSHARTLFVAAAAPSPHNQRPHPRLFFLSFIPLFNSPHRLSPLSPCCESSASPLNDPHHGHISPLAVVCGWVPERLIFRFLLLLNPRIYSVSLIAYPASGLSDTQRKTSFAFCLRYSHCLNLI